MEEGIRARLTRRVAEKRRSNLKWFGIGLGLILGFVAWRAFGRARPWAPLPALAAAAALAAGLAKPESLEAVYRPWMRAAGLLAKVNTYLILGTLYYLLISPYAWLARRLGAEALDDAGSGAATFWKTRSGLPARDSYRMQF